MWWTTLFCGLLATIVTSYKVFDEQEAPTHLSESPGEYKNMYWFEYPKCEDIEAGAKKFVISSPTETFINTCTGKEEKSNECFCKVPISRRSVQYDQENCKQYEAHPKANCKEFIFCSGVIRYIMTCGAGTVFNPKNKACDHPDNVKCPEKKSIEPPCPHLGKFPDVNSGCRSYFECQFGVIKKRHCQDNLIFDTWTHFCNIPQNSFCGCSDEASQKC